MIVLVGVVQNTLGAQLCALHLGIKLLDRVALKLAEGSGQSTLSD